MHIFKREIEQSYTLSPRPLRSFRRIYVLYMELSLYRLFAVYANQGLRTNSWEDDKGTGMLQGNADLT